MGSTFSIVLYGIDPDQMESAISAAFAEVRRLDDMLSNFLSASEWSKVNRMAGLGPVSVSEELFRLLAACEEYSRLTDGAFDISVGPLVDAWGFLGGSGHLPDQATVTSARSRVGHDNIHLDAAARTVRFGRQGMYLDPGGIGKGYAVDNMAGVLRRHGVENALVTGSASSIYGLGVPPDHSEGWPVDILDPLNPRKPLCEVFLNNLALSTTGSRAKSFSEEGRSYSHVIDPRTGYPASGALQVSVLSPRAIDGEAWAKPFFINGRDWTEARKPVGFRTFMCEGTPEHECSWV
jgi:thiamine biosynthesis lipoprotein